MADRSASNICNVAVVGHGGAGKTTFVDRALSAVGFTKRPGDVDAGTSLSDYDADEKEHRFSVNSTVFHFSAHDRAFNLIDTPGYLDFAGAAVAALYAVETAVVAVSAREGVQLNTRRMWNTAVEKGLARVVLITRIDGDNINVDSLLAEIRKELGPECRTLFLPVGLGQDCTGVVNVLETEDAPEGVVGDFGSARQQFRESIIECDDALMERYLEGEEVSQSELVDVLGRAVAAGNLVPVLCCAARSGIGVKETIRFLAACAPAPADGVRRSATDANGEEAVLEPDPDGPLCARVFRTTTDVHVGKIAYLRTYSGSLSGDLNATLARTGKTLRLGHLYVIKGEDQEEVREGVPGDILCVAKLEELRLGDTLCDAQRVLTLPKMDFPNPMMSLAVEPESREDEEKISVGLQELAEGDPTLKIERRQQSGELVITGMSNLHLDVMLSKLRRRHEISVATREPSTPYLETITRSATAQYRHKKQTGGRGQYGEVYLRVEPNERGEGFEFIDEIRGGVIPRQFLPAIEKGIREQMEQGLLAGYPIVDLKAAAYDGSHHSVDSSEAAFKIAGGRAFRRCFEEAKPVLLEPIASMEVTIPTQFMGDVTGNLTGHRGRILGMDQEGQMQVIRAEIPMAEVTRYSTELKSMTGGEGTFTLEFARYQTVPPHIQQEIVARHTRKQE
ncbi:MAG: elongation factor G, partial [Candidatus Brocadiaceae bacterium]